MRLENLVYYRSSGAFSEAATHYFIMTTDVASLHAFGVLREATLEDVRAASGLPADDGTAQLCQPSNVDSERLELYARAAVALFVPPLATQAMIDGQLSLFDFSERKQSNRAAMLVERAALAHGGCAPKGVGGGGGGCGGGGGGGGGDGGGPASRVLVTRVGDALQEPFWPEGLGINRGFLGALDCAHLVQHYAALRRERPEDVEECVARRDELFGLTKVSVAIRGCLMVATATPRFASLIASLAWPTRGRASPAFRPPRAAGSDWRSVHPSAHLGPPSQVVSGHNRKAELRDHLEATAAWRSDAEKAYSYTIQPHTRYLKWGSKEPAPPSKGASAADEEEPVEPRGASLPVEFIASLFG